MEWLWIAVVVVLIIIAFSLVKFRHFKYRMFLVFLIIVLLFIYFTASSVLAPYHLNLKTMSGIGTGAKIYFAWLGDAFGNVRTLTSNAVKMDWSLKNSTLEKKNITI